MEAGSVLFVILPPKRSVIIFSLAVGTGSTWGPFLERIRARGCVNWDVMLNLRNDIYIFPFWYP